MNNIDYAVFFAYILSILTLGFYHARRSQGFLEYFLAGRSMHWFPIGISIMVTAFSAINYTAFSGEVFANGSYVLLSLPVFVLVAWPVTRVIMPLYHSMNVSSAYEYLERRFDVRVRRVASGLFILWRLLWMATLIYVPCTVLALITGIDTGILILLAGAIATVYTLAGGMRAVMWTDVIQFFVLCGGVILSIGIGSWRHPDGLTGMLQSGIDAGLGRPFHPFDARMFALDPTIRITLWSSWIGTFVAFLARYGADQVVVQRYFTARSLHHARRGFQVNYISAIFALLLLGLMGFAIHSHAVTAMPTAHGGSPPVFFFSQFVRSLPVGATGLIVAGLFAATMSSIDSGINSCTAALISDFHRQRQNPDKGPGELFLSRAGVVLFGSLATFLSLHVGRLGSIFEIANRIINAMGSPLLALFLLGLFSRRVNRLGAAAGGLLATIASAWICFTVDPLALHYYAVANLLVSLALIYGCSLIENAFYAPPSPAQLGWTWYGRAWNEAPPDRSA